MTGTFTGSMFKSFYFIKINYNIPVIFKKEKVIYKWKKN
jgi:hypothetical protein